MKIKKEIKSLANPEKAKILQRFFKTGEGEYGEGDRFYGITVPELRKVSKKYLDLAFDELQKLIDSPWHEERMVALFILLKKEDKKKAVDFYLKNTHKINNWDLVDLTAPTIIGEYGDKKIVDKLSNSKDLWEKRIAMLATFTYLKEGDNKYTFKLARKFLKEEHDLMHKAVGWMLRESGKRVSTEDLESFIEQYGGKMPRTMLRYAIERLPEKKRKQYLALGKKS